MHDHAAKPDVPEGTPQPGQDASGGSQSDDINIPLVAVSVAFFGCLLAVTIISLQAWFMHADRAEIAAKTAAQEDPSTDLGKLLQKQRAQLLLPPEKRQPEPAATTLATTSGTSQPAPKLWIPIDNAMQLVSQEYTQGAKP